MSTRIIIFFNQVIVSFKCANVYIIMVEKKKKKKKKNRLYFLKLAILSLMINADHYTEVYGMLVFVHEKSMK